MSKGLSKDQILEVELELTGTCNLDCPLCARFYENAQHLVVKNIRPLPDWIAQLDQYPNLGFVCLAGSVSEPTMYKEFVGLVEYLVSRNIRIDLYTNANTHNPVWWEHLGTLLRSTDKVFFTVCGSTQAIHEVYRVKSSLQQVLDHASSLRKSGKLNDYIQPIRFEYNAEDLESDAMKAIIDQFSKLWFIESMPYQERFGIIKDTNTPIKMVGKLAEKYNIIKDSALNRYDTGTSSCKMSCKSFETQNLYIDNFGNEFPCHLYKIYKKTPFDHTDYSSIHKFENRFCYECESLTTTILEINGLERMV